LDIRPLLIIYLSIFLLPFQTEFLHDIWEQPWGHQVLRAYDPDGHIVEIAETMEEVVWGFSVQGQTPDQISARTGMPKAFVEQAIQQKNAVK
jgi:hypothetical protein